MKPAELRLRILRHEVAQCLGRPVVSKADCRLLSDAVLARTGDLLSDNTLGRLFGVVPPVVPRQSTLDILARFCGHPHYAQFCRWADEQTHHHPLAQPAGQDPTFFSAQLLRLCLQNGHYDTVVQAFGLLPDTLDYYTELSRDPARMAELSGFVDVLSAELRRNPQHIKLLLPQLARLPQGRLLVFEFSVDRLYQEPEFIKALQGEYARWQPEADDAQRTEKLVFVHATAVRALAESGQMRQARRLWTAELENLPAEAVSHSREGVNIYPVTRYWVERSRIYGEDRVWHTAQAVLHHEAESVGQALALEGTLFNSSWIWDYYQRAQ